MDKFNTVLLFGLIAITAYQLTQKTEVTHQLLADNGPDMNAGFNSDFLEHQFAALAVQLADIQNQLAGLKSSNRSAETVQIQDKQINQTSTYKNEIANNFVDDLIGNGIVSQQDIIQLHKHIAELDPTEQQKTLRRLIVAINEQRVDFDPTSFP